LFDTFGQTALTVVCKKYWNGDSEK